MRVLFVDTIYRRFLSRFHAGRSRHETYKTRLEALHAELFGTSDFYSSNLRKLGHECWDVVFNDPDLQGMWAREHNVSAWGILTCRGVAFELLNRVGGLPARVKPPYSLLTSQIRHYRPDVLYVQNIAMVDQEYLRSVRDSVGAIVGQVAYPISWRRDYSVYDLIVTSLPHFVSRFRSLGVRAEYLPLAFEPKVLANVPQERRDLKCTFVGGISRDHGQGTCLLESVAKSLDEVRFYGYGFDQLPADSAIRRQHGGEAWGRSMFALLRRSRLTINRHSIVAGEYANNMRLFEATGCGALLLTESRRNLGDLFEVGREVIAYETVAELIQQIKYYSNNIDEAALIAAAGQSKTLRDHTYAKRAVDLHELISSVNW